MGVSPCALRRAPPRPAPQPCYENRKSAPAEARSLPLRRQACPLGGTSSVALQYFDCDFSFSSHRKGFLTSNLRLIARDSFAAVRRVNWSCAEQGQRDK